MIDAQGGWVVALFESGNSFVQLRDQDQASYAPGSQWLDSVIYTDSPYAALMIDVFLDHIPFLRAEHNGNSRQACVLLASQTLMRCNTLHNTAL